MTILRTLVGVTAGAGFMFSISASGVSAGERSLRPATDDHGSPAINWSGIYLGVHGGWIRPDIRTTDAGIFGGPFPAIAPDSGAFRHYDLGDKVVTPTVSGVAAPFDAAKIRRQDRRRYTAHQLQIRRPLTPAYVRTDRRRWTTNQKCMKRFHKH